jgi:tRNA(adenine34) deaminase
MTMNESNSMPTTDQHWMQHALTLAAKAEALGEVPVGAVVVKDGAVVGEGWNQPISGHDPTAHAEIMALRQAAQRLQNYRLPGCEMYITIEPCTMCAGAIVHARISRVIFAAPEPKAGAVLSNGQVFDAEHMNHRVTYTSGVCEDEAVAQIQAFFKRRRAEAKALRKQSPDSH